MDYFSSRQNVKNERFRSKQKKMQSHMSDEMLPDSQ